MTAHIYEPELNVSPPRSVCYRDGFKGGFGLWVGRVVLLPHTLIGIALLGMALYGSAEYIRVWIFGDDWEGRVVQKTDYKGGKGGHYYGFVYTYTVDGIEHRGQVSTTSEHYAEVTEGQPITVRALESRPDRSQWPLVPGYHASTELGSKWFVALFWNGIMSIFVCMVYVSPWRMRCLIRDGVPTQGIIREVREGQHKGATYYHMLYEYAVPSPDGLKGTVLSKRMTTKRTEGKLAKEGDVVTVLFHPKKPSRSVIYRYAHYRVA